MKPHDLLQTAKTRIEILLSRMRGCNQERQGHDLSLAEGEGWLDEMEGILATPDEDFSDGHHTFKELYEHRHALFAALCYVNGHSWKSKLHADGTMYDGWFIAGMETMKGPISYHLPLSWWDKIHGADLERAPEWDGHTPTDVVQRILGSLVNLPANVNVKPIKK